MQPGPLVPLLLLLLQLKQTHCYFPHRQSDEELRTLEGEELSEACSHKPGKKDQWEYCGPHSPEHWPSRYASCNGPRQSPIDLDVHDMALEPMAQLTFSNFERKGGVRCNLRNNGHTVTVSFQGFQSFLQGGPLEGQYRLEQIHFHWGKHNNMGSEHTVSRDRLAMEMHAVHYNVNATIGDIVVLGFLYEVDTKEAPNQEDILIKILGKAANIPPNETLTEVFDIEGHNAEDLFGYTMEAVDSSNQGNKISGHLQDYCYYLGSLTTPPCSEVVTWILSRKLRKVPEFLLNNLRKLTGHGRRPLSNNFRFPQPLWNRRVLCTQHLAAVEGNFAVRLMLSVRNPSRNATSIILTLNAARADQAAWIRGQLLGSHLSPTSDGNLQLTIVQPEGLKRSIGRGKLGSLQLRRGLVVVSNTDGRKVFVLRNSYRMTYFEAEEYSLVGEITQGMRQLDRVISKVRIQLMESAQLSTNRIIKLGK